MDSKFCISLLVGLVLGVICHETSAQNYRMVCGRRRVKSVYLNRNGLDAKPGHWPWHAAIYDSKGVDYKCGGTVIDENTILTAASCVFEGSVINASDISVYLGRIHLSEDTEYTQALDAEEIILHPAFSGDVSNDIALIKLATNITMTKFVQPVCLWTMNDNPYTIRGMKGTIVGFGSENHLKQKTLGVVDATRCVASDREGFGKLRVSEMLCVAGQEGTGACDGDGGGGLFFEVEGKWYVRGIVSYISGDTENEICTTTKHAAFTDVTKYVNWIKKYIDPDILPVSSDLTDLDYDEKLQLFDLTTCGVASNSIAAGGVPWTLPWLGFVGIYRSLDNTVDKRCVVTLLNEWYAVGPAHCFQNDGLERRVLFGGNTELAQTNCDDQMSKEPCESPTQMLQIQRIIIHPTYNINNTVDNIALIELLDPADTTQPNVRPICIPIVPKLRSNATTDLSIATQTSSPISFVSKPVDYIDSENCTDKYDRQGFPLFLESKRFCTQISTVEEQNCTQLKAGTPLQERRKIIGKEQFFLRGFDLFEQSCSASLPSVHSNVNAYLDWMLYNMRYSVLEEADDTTNDEDTLIEESWNQLRHDPDQEKISFFNLDTCGVTATIANNATKIDRTFYPWMGLLVTHKNTMEPLTYIESAVVLISDRYAIAPAHIVSNSVSWRFVVLGYCNALLLVSCANAPCDHLFKKVEIKNILIHPSYAGDPKRHNIALIEFMKPADLQHRYIKPICLPLTKELRKSKPLELTVIPFRNYDNEIRNLTLMLPTSCQERFGQEGFVTTLKAAPLCAQETTVSKDRVTLKSGAMLQTSSRIDGQDRYFLRGINILNDTFEKTYQYLPYAFTNTDLYLDWILDNMNDESQESIASNDLVERLSVDSGAVSLPSVRQRFKKKLVNLNTCGVYPKVEQATNKLYSPWLGYVTAHPDPKDLLCMVILISEWYTVGPVHTIINRTDIKVQLGSMIDSSDVECEEGDESTLCDPELQRIPTTRMIVHPHFNPSDYSNDIMLLQLSRSVRKPQINPICLPVDDQIRSYDIANVRGHAFNLVSLNFVAKKLDEHTYIPSSECQKRWNQLALNWQLENVTQCVVAQFSPNTECLTTLPGFPVYTLQNINGRDRLFLRGFAKAWPHFCSKYYPVIYTNIDTYSDWILQNMDASLDYQQLSFDLHKELLFT
ncbi:uncharacterized protein LOC118507748 isoform X3 [Anopheles stephensi]|uniref:uncharacterized protein LOC118507748 isoform X3 n=1 Tax=Anopheles stephensi TaxID=30069 RepID=UPI0016587BC7|nr:uncharacterized protein LOC118507748 isoform X3 [Anopheles stephensi]